MRNCFLFVRHYERQCYGLSMTQFILFFPYKKIRQGKKHALAILTNLLSRIFGYKHE